jgi:hypothetical protein
VLILKVDSGMARALLRKFSQFRFSCRRFFSKMWERKELGGWLDISWGIIPYG